MKLSEEKFVVTGMESVKPILDISIGEIIYRNLLSNPDKHPALINAQTGESLKYSELLEETCSLAEAFRNEGYGPNTIIGISSKNNLQFFIPIISALYVGATVAPTSHLYTPTELEHTLNLSKPKIIFCSRDLVGKYSQLKKTLNFIEKLIIIDSDESTTEAECLKDFVRRNVKSRVSRISTTKVDVKEQVAFIMCSSGTTGLPKGVMLTHRNMNVLYNHFGDPRIHSQNKVTLCVPPFFHAFGLLTTLFGIMLSASIIFLEQFDPIIFLKSIQHYRVYKLYLAPAVVVFLLNSPSVFDYDLSSVNEVLCGAAPLKTSTEEEFKRRLNGTSIRQAYGLTESTLALTLNELVTTKGKPGSSGKVLPYVKLAVRNLENGEFMGPNKCGEICVKGDLLMKGYVGDPESTRKTFTKDGWLLTGDVGYYDEDGYFYITDRIKELIKYKGFQVAPAELEGVLLTHPEILDSGVVGLPDEKSGELPLAFVVKSKNSKLTQKEVQDFVKSKLSPQKWLRGGVIFVDKIPKSPIGKILRRELKLLLQNYKSKL